MKQYPETFSILVVGGGSAGWITANLLNATLARQREVNVQISLLESPNIPIIGVGEATVPSIRRTLQTIGLPEKQFISRCEATFKNAIRFENWNIAEQYDHPFDRRKRPESDAQVAQWLHGQTTVSFDKRFSLLSHLCDSNLCPKAPDWPDYGSTFPYAYHLDAVLFANYLAEWGGQNGITHILGDVENVRIGSDGNISEVITEKGETYSANLYVDCTGFKAKLIGEALEVQKKHFGDYLLCDRAATMRVPYDIYRPEKLKPYTRSRAMPSGWCWDINLQSRRGLGYVYSSAYCSPEQAETELRALEGIHSDALEIRHIHFETSKRHDSWLKNCVAIGLSDGFLEPLESSGLYMIEHAAHALAEMLPDFLREPGATRRHFNRMTQNLFYEVLEFLNVHYVTSKRRDTDFWKAATNDEVIWPELKDKFKLWQHRGPKDLDFSQNNKLFSFESFEFILFGSRYCSLVPEFGKSSPSGEMQSMLEKCQLKFPNVDAWLEMQTLHDDKQALR